MAYNQAEESCLTEYCQSYPISIYTPLEARRKDVHFWASMTTIAASVAIMHLAKFFHVRGLPIALLSHGGIFSFRLDMAVILVPQGWTVCQVGKDSLGVVVFVYTKISIWTDVSADNEVGLFGSCL